jgi:VWFA-related protein
MRYKPTVTLGLAGLLLSGVGFGQGSLPSAFGETVEVRVVNVEVVVTDKAGNRVHGLSPSDFSIEVDGKPMSLDYFSEIKEGVLLAPPQGVAAIAGGEFGQPLGTSYLLFIDDYSSIPRDRDKVLQALREDVTFLGPADRIAVVAFDGKSVEMLSTWTGSWPEVQQTLERAKDRPAFGLHRLTELRTYRRDARLRVQTPGVRGDFGDARLDIEEERYAWSIADQVGRSIAGATAAMRGFAKPPGRKVMLVLSGGWPFDPVNVATGDPSRGFAERSIPRGRELFAPLVDTANQLGYTLYPVDVPGLEATAIADASADLPAGGNFDANREYELHQGLYFLANQTGGEAMLNARRLEPLRLVSQDTRSFYWLGFTPERRGDNARHEVVVRVARPGLEVRSREDYVDSSRQAEVTMAVESALLFGSGTTSDGALRVDLGEPVRSRINRVKVPLTVDVPLDKVTALPVGDAWQVVVELRVAVRDSGGSTAEVPVVPITLTTAEEPGPGKWGRFKTEVELRRADHDLLVAIFDPASGNLLTSPARLEM